MFNIFKYTFFSIRNDLPLEKCFAYVLVPTCLMSRHKRTRTSTQTHTHTYRASHIRSRSNVTDELNDLAPFVMISKARKKKLDTFGCRFGEYAKRYQLTLGFSFWHHYVNTLIVSPLENNLTRNKEAEN